MNISSPRYLGPACMPGAVYIGSLHDKKAEIICFKGNMLQFPDADFEAEGKENSEKIEYATARKRGQAKM